MRSYLDKRNDEHFNEINKFDFRGFERDFLEFFTKPSALLNTVSEDSSNPFNVNALPVNIIEKDDALIFEALSSVKPKVVLKNLELTISIVKQTEKSEGGKFIRKEFGYGEVSRTFKLSATGLDLSNIDAEYENGKLVVVIRKTRKPTEFEIDVKDTNTLNEYVSTVSNQDSVSSVVGLNTSGEKTETLREREGE